MEVKERQGVGGFIRSLAEAGITDLDAASDKLRELVDDLKGAGIFGWDRYTEFGSDSFATVITDHDQKRRECILWCLNHYLGLNRHPGVIGKAKAALERFGTGCGTSAVSGGMSSLHKEVEREIATMLGKEKALLFPTGYTANLGALSAIPGKNAIILFDHEAHASIIDGCRLSGKPWMAFRHNDVENLESKLRRCESRHDNVIVVVESAYSMSGDLCPVREIAALKRKYRFYLYVDEAHTFGLYGEQGRGYCHAMGVVDQVDFIMSTLSKSTASIGGFLAAKEKLCNWIQANSNSYLFQACLTPADAATILAALQEIRQNPTHSEALHLKNAYFRKQLVELGFNLGTSQSPVVPIYISDIETLYAFSKDLYENGIFSVSVTYPAVKLKEGRMRFIVNASHTQKHLDRTIAILGELGRKYGVI